MRICRGASTVPVLVVLAFIALLAPPAAGQQATTASTVAQPSSTTDAGGAGASITQPQQSGTSSPLGTGVPSTTAPGEPQSTVLAPGGGGELGAPGRGAVLILVRRLSWRQAAAVVRGRSETIAAGMVSTLPTGASLAARVLSLAAGRQVDASALAGGADAAAIERMRAANPDAHFGGLPRVRVVAATGLEAAALIGLGSAGGPPPVAPLEVTGPPPPAPDELLVVAVPDAAGLQRVLAQLQAPGSGSLGSGEGGAGGGPGVPDTTLSPGTTLAPGTSAAPGTTLSPATTLAPGTTLGPGITLAPGAPGAPGVPGAAPMPTRFVIVGLEAPAKHARTAPLIALGGAPGLVTSDSTRRRGLVAYQDVRPTLAASAAGTDGSAIRVVSVVDPLGSVGRLDRKVVSLVTARSWAIPLAATVGSLALAMSLLALLLRRRPGEPRGREVLRRLARALLLLSLALPSGYLVSSEVAPMWWVRWLLLGVGASVALALAAWLVSRSWPLGRSRAAAAAPNPTQASALKVPAAAATSSPPPGAASTPDAGAEVPPATADRQAGKDGARGDASTGAVGSGPPVAVPAGTGAGAGAGPGASWAPPALLGAFLAGLIVVDLLLGGLALSRPLLGNSAFDGERFYGLGNGYFAYALAGVFLVVAFRQPSIAVATVLLAGLAFADGLPILGADVGGALTATLTAAAALLLLRSRRWSWVRTLLVVIGALLIAVAIAFGVGLATHQMTHGSRIARELLGSDPSAALRAVQRQLSGNFGLLAGNFWAWWGPLLVAAAAVASLRPPGLLASVPAQVRRAVGVGAIGSLLLILLNDTGVTAAAGSGLALMVTFAWCALEPSPAAPATTDKEPPAAPTLEFAAASAAAAEPARTQASDEPADGDGGGKTVRVPAGKEPASASSQPDAAPHSGDQPLGRNERPAQRKPTVGQGDLPSPPSPASRWGDPPTPPKPASRRDDPPAGASPASDRAGPARARSSTDNGMTHKDPGARDNDHNRSDRGDQEDGGDATGG